MSYVYSRVDELEGKDKVGTKECVALIQQFTDAGPTSGWKAGQVVLGNRYIVKGTAIATFVRGRYPNRSHGNHAAFFLRQGMNGIYVMDQWSASNKLFISERFLRSQGKERDGTFTHASNNAEAFYVIEPY